jgi:uncharacterized protein (TIGR03437 family)
MKTTLTVLAFLAAATLCEGGTLAGSPVSASAGSDTRSFVIGWKFQVSSPVTVSALAYLDSTGAGLAEAHTVGIFNEGGNLLVSATVPAGPNVTYQNGFRLAVVSFTLQPGIYVIGGLRQSNADAAMVRAASVETVPQVTYLGERELESATFAFPSGTVEGNEKGAFGPSFVISDTPPSQKTITSVLNSGSFGPQFAAGTYVSIFGTNLSTTTRAWAASDFGGGVRLPVSLDGISVNVNGTPAYVQYVSPGQLNIIIPDTLTADAGVPVTVRYPGQPDVTSWVRISSAAPAFFTWPTGTADSGKYVVAQHANSTNIGKVGLFPQLASNFTTPAKPGETIVIYGTGFGPTNPFLPGGIIADKSYPLSPLPSATIGGRQAAVAYAGLVASLSNVYQLNVTLPADLPDGDWPIILNVGSNASTPSLITVAR